LFQHAIHQRRLTVVNVGDDGNIADVISGRNQVQSPDKTQNGYTQNNAHFRAPG
jgi:hypothetical protein